MGKEDMVHACIYTHTHTHTHTQDYHSAIKKYKIIMLNEVSQKEKDKYHMVSLIYRI